MHCTYYIYYYLKMTWTTKRRCAFPTIVHALIYPYLNVQRIVIRSVPIRRDIGNGNVEYPPCDYISSHNTNANTRLVSLITAPLVFGNVWNNLDNTT